jgi:hypothetical protein
VLIGRRTIVRAIIPTIQPPLHAPCQHIESKTWAVLKSVEARAETEPKSNGENGVSLNDFRLPVVWSMRVV